MNKRSMVFRHKFQGHLINQSPKKNRSLGIAQYFCSHFCCGWFSPPVNPASYAIPMSRSPRDTPGRRLWRCRAVETGFCWWSKRKRFRKISSDSMNPIYKHRTPKFTKYPQPANNPTDLFLRVLFWCHLVLQRVLPCFWPSESHLVLVFFMWMTGWLIERKVLEQRVMMGWWWIFP